MLLVKSKESKNLGNKLPYKSLAWVFPSLLIILPFSAQAEPQSLSNPSSVVSIFLSLLLVVGVVFMLAFLMRRFNVTHSGSSQLKVVASMMAGTRERIMVIDVGGEQHLVGVTPQNINHLATLAKPLEQSKTNGSENFKDKLALFMAGKLNPQAEQSTNNKAGNKDE
jgi:flagellar protein FliO/FliZ